MDTDLDAPPSRRGSAGGVVFLAHVNHPGTKKNPFVQRAMQRVIQESGGLAVSA